MNEIEIALKILGNETIYVEYVMYDYENYENNIVKTSYTTEQILNEIMEDYYYKEGDIASITSFGVLREMYENIVKKSDCNLYIFIREEEYKEHQKEEKRRKLEKHASSFAKECGYAIDTFEFIEKLEEKIGGVREEQERFNSSEAKMERWMDYSYAGCKDSYWTDNNFENGRYSARRDYYEDIFEWLHENCPLLMAKYKESKLNHTD